MTRLCGGDADEAITRIAIAQNQLLDHSGHVTRGLSREARRVLIEEIQRLRAAVGWKPLDMTGRTRRPQKGNR